MVAGTCSSTSETSSPSVCQAPPQSGQQAASGTCSWISRQGIGPGTLEYRRLGGDLGCRCRGSGGQERVNLAAGDVQLLKLQFQLIDLVGELLGLASEEHALELLDHQLQTNDLGVARVG